MRVFKLLVIGLFLNLQALALASVKPISCTTNFGEKSFTIEGTTVAFHQDKDGRSISSVLGSKTLRSHTGFKKTLYKDGSKHLIHIEDITKFNSNNDFIAITTQKGHKMTFPINCLAAK